MREYNVYSVVNCKWNMEPPENSNYNTVYDGAGVVPIEYGNDVIGFINQCLTDDKLPYRLLSGDVLTRPLTETDSKRMMTI